MGVSEDDFGEKVSKLATLGQRINYTNGCLNYKKSINFIDTSSKFSFLQLIYNLLYILGDDESICILDRVNDASKDFSSAKMLEENYQPDTYEEFAFSNSFHMDDNIPASQSNHKFVIDDEIDNWSPIKNFKTIEELKNASGNTANRVDYLINKFSKSEAEDRNEKEPNKTGKPSKNSSSKSNFGTRGNFRGRGKSNYRSF